MEVIKKINNNAAICIDSSGIEMIAIGTGIGFPKVPYTLNDLSKVQNTYYDVNPMYLELLNQIPQDIFKVSSRIVEGYKLSVNDSISSNVVFTLADHINFAIERDKKNMIISNPLQYDVQHLYEKEYEIGLQAIKLIQNSLKIRLPKVEATNIALHFINAASVANQKKEANYEEALNDVLEIIGDYFKLHIDKNSVNYSRFVTHFQYLMKREEKKELISSSNSNLYDLVLEQYPQTCQCVDKIKDYLKIELQFDLNKEEALYLVLHVNRLCTREDCYRKGITPVQ